MTTETHSREADFALPDLELVRARAGGNAASTAEILAALRNAGTVFNAAAVALGAAATVIASTATTPITVQGSGRFRVSGTVDANTIAGFTTGSIQLQTQIGAGAFAVSAIGALAGPAAENASGAVEAIINTGAAKGTIVNFELTGISTTAGDATVPSGGTLATAGGLLTWQEIP